MEKTQKSLKLEKLYSKYEVKHPGREMVFGDGNPDTGIVMVGEAPGKDEVRLSRPFVGIAGGYLGKFMDYMGWSRDDIYVTNAIKYRLSKINPKTGRKSNRPARVSEVRDSMMWLSEELDIICPKLVVTLGNVPLKSASMDQKLSIGDVHGKTLKAEGRLIFPLYHPASIIYNRALEDIYYCDLDNLKEILLEV